MDNQDALTVESITSEDGLGTGIKHGDIIVRLVNATLRNDDTLTDARQAVIDTFGMDGLIDIAGVIGTFTMQTRIADATGLPFDRQFEMGTRTLRKRLGANDFQSAQNTSTGGVARALLSKILEPIVPTFLKMMSSEDAKTPQ